jgi:peptidoglycan/xylan/chitin deacetylase (PgdA/CDA1 family)
MIIKIKYIKIFFIVVALLLVSVTATITDYYKSKATITKPVVRLPIIMYHQILKDKKTWGKYVISPDDFEKDLIYFVENGYTSITMQDLIDFAYNDKKLPDKPIMITFDDGYLTSKVYVLPLLKKYNLKAVVSIVGEFTDRFSEIKDDRVSYAHVNWDDVNELISSGYIEIQNHSYNMHKISKRKGIIKLRKESLEDYRKALNNDILHMQDLMENKTGYKPVAFTYPFGSVCKDAEPILRDMGFLALLTCNEGVNLLSGDKEELYSLKRYNRPYGIDRVKFFSTKLLIVEKPEQ